MSVEEKNTLEEWQIKYKSEVCDAMECNNPAIDFVILEPSGGFFFLNRCESHREEAPELKDPAIYQSINQVI